MLRIQVPKRFNLGGVPIIVKDDPELFLEESAYGEAHYRGDKIVLQPSVGGVPISERAYAQHFLHEFVHHLLYRGGEDGLEPPLHMREFLVNRLASLLLEAVETAEFEGDAPGGR